MQRTVRAGRAAVAETTLGVVVEDQSGHSVAGLPAAAAPDTTSREIPQNAATESVADGVDMSGYGV